MVKQQHCESETSEPASKKLKVVLSVLVILHLMALFLPPMAFQATGVFGSSPSVSMLLWPVERYGQFIYVDRGYAFFAPDPGPSHLIQAAVTEADGSVVESLYPDLNEQWPRLKYHRHFMLAEFLNDVYQPPGPPEELIQNDRPAADEWARLRERYEHLRQSIIDHLRSTNGGKEVAIRRIEHLIPTFVEYTEEPISLDDRRLYVVLLDQVEQPSGPPETIPPPSESDDNDAAENHNDEPLTAPESEQVDDKDAEAAQDPSTDSQAAVTEDSE